MWFTCLSITGALIAVLLVIVIGLRMRFSMQEKELRGAIVAYAAGRGGSAVFEPDGQHFMVKGPRGEGRMGMTSLRVMCRPGEQQRWEFSIGLALKRYIPDATDDAFAEAARQRLVKLAPTVEAMTEEELRSHLRVKISRTQSDAAGLATCARALGDSFEARVVLQDIDLNGIPEKDRARLPDTHDALFERALTQTLGEPVPKLGAGEANSLAWLCSPEAIFGNAPHLIVASGKRLVWTPVAPDDVEPRLAALCRASSEKGVAQNVLFAWDGAVLSGETIMVHTIMGPNTPDYTLRVPTSFHAEMGIHASSAGTFGVRR